jgi:hypothetical protein
VLKKCFALMDLTTLKSNDTVASVSKLVDKVNRLPDEYPDYPLPASVCVYPNFASVVRERRCSPELHVTTVASCFPSAQSFLEVKVQECVLAVRGGADEIDIVLALNAFLAGDYEAAAHEIVEMKKAIDAEAALAGRKVVIRRNLAGQVHGRFVFAHLFGLGEDRHPQEHLDSVRVQIITHLPVDVLVQAPTDDDFLDRDLRAHLPDPADDLFCRIVGRMPASERHLDDVAGLGGLVLAGREKQQAGHEGKDSSHRE